MVLPSLDELPLHGLPGVVYACQAPEAPGTSYDGRCPECLALAKRLPKPPASVRALLDLAEMAAAGER